MFRTAMLALAALFVAPPVFAQTASPFVWPEPKLENPITIRPDKDDSTHRLRAGQDYIIELPKDGVKRGGLTLLGGRNIVMIGGSITVPKSGSAARAVYIRGATGTVHIEGVEIPCTPGVEFDAFAINAPLATVQLQYIRACAHGTQSRFHGDLIQPWGGVKQLRVAYFTGFGGYQGLQLPDDTSAQGTSSFDIRYTDLYSTGRQTSESGGYLVWLIKGSDCNKPIRGSFFEVYVNGREGRDPGKVIWPDRDNRACAPKISGSNITFDGLPVTGELTIGRPLVEFVPAGVAGLNYRRGISPVPAPTPSPVPAEPNVTTITVRSGETLIVRGE